MPLIIEIHKEIYEEIKCDEACGLHELTRAIANGIPLDDIRAEIQKKADSIPFDDDELKGLDEALAIINEHTRGKK